MLFLAAKSLDSISENNLLAISHLDIADGLMEYASVSAEGRRKILSALGQKNVSGMLEALSEEGIDLEKSNLIASLSEIYGAPSAVIPRLEKFRVNEKCSQAIDSLLRITDALTSMGVSKISIDFSLVGNMKYYNGITVKGFIEGVPQSVISGGQYDNLMRKMGRKSKAIGFAVYLDEIDRLPVGKALL